MIIPCSHGLLRLLCCSPIKNLGEVSLQQSHSMTCCIKIGYFLDIDRHKYLYIYIYRKLDTEREREMDREGVRVRVRV